MTPERWKKIEDIFQQALDCPAAEREKFIAAKSGGDEELRLEVEKLVARMETDESFLESPVWTDSLLLQSNFKREIASSLEENASSGAFETLIGKQIGVYKLVKELGRGGMGIVFLAERADGEFYQKVAIKLIKRGMDTDFIVRRFRHERQILANLNHPNIARLLDGGTTGDGLPYFVMEFVDGAPFFKYCEAKDLDLRQKLELFLQVCAAISYAHKRKIIHRDIKPSNILVTDDGAPKLLDFGIGKILDPDLIHESIIPTATAMRLMTPEYASPEQARGEEITEASDQYSLGVLLYELITGVRPYKFPSRAPHEIARIICEEIPSEPSSGSFGKSTTGEIDLRFDEDFCKKLDRIVLKSLRKNPLERYASVEDFAADIERFLRNENVRAETSVKTSGNDSNKTKAEKIFQTGKTEPNKRETLAAESLAAASPRRKGIKTGIFITLTAFLLFPLFLLLVLATELDPAILLLILAVCFFGGITRIVYALLFEPKNAQVLPPEKTAGQIGEAETKLIDFSAPRDTIFGSTTTAEKTGENEKSIAVLPFKNLNALAGNPTGGSEFLSVGLADALITRISNVRRLVVRPTSSVLKFGAGAIDSLEVGMKLNVQFIVEGSIVKTEKRIRVSVQLLDVANRSSVWAEKFDEDLTDYFDLEDSICTKVVQSLLPKISGDDQKQMEKRGTENSAAHEFYLRGRYYWNLFTEAGFAQAIEFYRKAVELDSNYAHAHAAIAEYYVWLGIYSILPPTEAYRSAQIAAEKAIALDDRLAEAHAALGMARIYGNFDWIAGRRSMEYALQLNETNATAHVWYSYALLAAQEIDEAISHIERAIELDPSSFAAWMLYAFAFYFARDFETALEKTAQVLEKFPDFPYSYLLQSSILRLMGRYDEAIAAAHRSVAISKGSVFYRYVEAHSLAAAGLRQEAEKTMSAIETEIRMTEQSPSHYLTAIFYIFLKEKNKAFDALEKAFAERDGLLIWIAVEPSFDLLRKDARYRKLLEKMNHPLAGNLSSAPRNIENKRPTEKTTTRSRQKKRGISAVFKYALFPVALIAFGFLSYNFFTHLKIDTSAISPENRWKNNFASTMTARRLTTSGTAITAAISPDGKRVVFAERDGDAQSLFIRSTDAASDEPSRRLVAPSADNFISLEFAPSGDAVFYNTYNPNTAEYALRRINADGNGGPQQILSDVSGAVGFAPDGKRIAYFRYDQKARKMSVLAAGLDSDGARAENVEPQMIAEQPLPGYFTANPAFSPDGQKVVFASVSIVDGKEILNLYAADLKTARAEKLGTTDFDGVSKIEWRAGGEEIVLSANRQNTEPLQLLLVSYPSGEVTRLTSDLDDYSGVSLSQKTPDSLVTTKKTRRSGIAVIDLQTANGDRETPLTTLTSGDERRDGMRGISWTRDGQIVFTAGTGEENNVAVINSDGTNRQSFNLGDAFPASPILTADDRFLFFLDQKNRESILKRFEPATGETRQMNAGMSLSPALSPDNRFITVSALGDSMRMSLHRVPIEGGEQIKIIDGSCIRAATSPDGRFITCYYKPDQFAGKWKLTVFSSTGGTPVRILDLPNTVNLQNAHELPLAWSADSRSIYYLNDKGGVSNIYRVKTDENNPMPEQVTRFTKGRIFDFAVSPDGKKAALARGETASNVIIFRKTQ